MSVEVVPVKGIWVNRVLKLCLLQATPEPLPMQQVLEVKDHCLYIFFLMVLRHQGSEIAKPYRTKQSS